MVRVRKDEYAQAQVLLERYASRITWSECEGGLWLGAGSELECVVVSLGAPLVEVAHLKPLVTTEQGVLDEQEFQVDVSREGVLLAGRDEVRFLSAASPRLLAGPAGFLLGQGSALEAELVVVPDIADAPVLRYRWEGWEELVGVNVAVRRKT